MYSRERLEEVKVLMRNDFFIHSTMFSTVIIGSGIKNKKLDLSKLKAFADKIINVIENFKFVVKEWKIFLLI